jgi:hypothetical protein
MHDPVYILIRTSRRPLFFSRMMRSVKEQTYKNIVTIVHSDDPRDEYVTGDIVIRGSAYGKDVGNGTYNLYNNRLLSAIPDRAGWIHFIDDDDEYVSPDAIENFVKSAKRDHVNVARVKRWNDKIFPNKWFVQKSFQTECFLIHTDYKNSAQWWPHLGDDHQYSEQLTKILPINWIENLIICRAQEGKGRGQRLDQGHIFNNKSDVFKPESKVCVFCLSPYRSGSKDNWLKQGTFKYIFYKDAIMLEKLGKIKITYKDVTITKQGDRHGSV